MPFERRNPLGRVKKINPKNSNQKENLIIIQEKTKKQVKCAKDVARIINALLNARGEEDAHKEMMYCIGLTAKNTVLYVDLSGIGTVNYCNPPLREIFRLALIKNAVSVIISHNHPSGELSPSREDRLFTDEAVRAGKILSLPVLDHIIIGDKGEFVRFSDEGLV
jgi:DNA repair protein RadC